jgi:ABC-2 type transport system permease protein
MTFTDAAAQSKTFARAWGDLTDGFGKRELWLHLGWQDIKQRYRRSVLGPFWITIATGTTAVAGVPRRKVPVTTTCSTSVPSSGR